MDEKIKQAFRQQIALDCVMFGEPLSRHSTWKIGGPADILIIPEDVGQIKRTVDFCLIHNIPWVVIGDGSNLLFADEGFRGVIIKISTPLSRINICEQSVYAEAGAWAPALAFQAAKASLSGLEHIIGIPGRIGGLVYMNGGSLRKGIGESVTKVHCVDADGAERAYTRDECCFSYRNSCFQQQKQIITSVELELVPGSWLAMRKELREILQSRRHKFPRKRPNCGSVFKSDAELYAKAGPPGKLIEECGLKGRRIGGVEVSPLHANFIINIGNGKASDVLALVSEIRARVFDKYGALMDTEVQHVTPDGKIVPVSEVI